MKYNQYYNKEVMNLKQLARDLERQGFTCEIAEDGEYLTAHYLCYLDYVEISLTGYKDWSVDHYQPFKGVEIYHAATNWGSYQVVEKTHYRCIKIAQQMLGYHILFTW